MANTAAPTVPASFESALFIPASARLTPLARAALENGVSGDDVRAYLSATLTETYKVKFFDAKASRKGKGIRVSYFSDLAAAEKFASENRIYAGPCKVETLRPLPAGLAAKAGVL